MSEASKNDPHPYDWEAAEKEMADHLKTSGYPADETLFDWEKAEEQLKSLSNVNEREDESDLDLSEVEELILDGPEIDAKNQANFMQQEALPHKEANETAIHLMQDFKETVRSNKGALQSHLYRLSNGEFSPFPEDGREDMEPLSVCSSIMKQQNIHPEYFKKHPFMQNFSRVRVAVDSDNASGKPVDILSIKATFRDKTHSGADASLLYIWDVTEDSHGEKKIKEIPRVGRVVGSVEHLEPTYARGISENDVEFLKALCESLKEGS